MSTPTIVSSPQKTKKRGLAYFGANSLAIGIFIHILFGMGATLHAQSDGGSGREPINLSGAGWQFMGASENGVLPAIDSDEFKQSAWTDIAIPHNFQTRAAFNDITKGWYRRSISVDSSMAGKELYLVFEGAAAIADVYVNGQHLGQHRGAYTRFIFDATASLHPGQDNQLAIQVDNSPASTVDCLPNGDGLYKVWGGLYRKVWLVAVSQVHIDPTDDASPGVYLTPKNISDNSADLDIRVLLRNTSASDVNAEIRARVLDPAGNEVKTLTAPAQLPANGRATVELSTTITQPQLWEPLKGRLYQVQTGVYVNGQRVDEVTESTGFRWLDWDWNGGTVTVNGKQVILAGANLHQEIESKGSAVSDEDLKHNFDFIQDLGMNFLRLPHYPHARLEYDLCDQDGILCWAENGNSNGRWTKKGDIVSPTAVQITTEMVKQNYNHPSIVLWSVGNEAATGPADQCVPIVKALDPSRPVVVANMKSELADFKTKNDYPGWYKGGMQSFQPDGFYSEIGAGGVVTVHCDYNQCDWKVDRYEPEEYQQLVAENHFQNAFHGDNSHLGLFCWWALRDFTDVKYKKPIGINSKGLVTYAGNKKDVYYLYRSFLRPDEPTLWITSKRYFLRRGAVDNGIKVYSNARQVTLTLNGETVSTLDNGQYTIPDGPWAHHPSKKAAKKDDADSAPESAPEASLSSTKVDNVFYWPASLHTGKNIVVASDNEGHSDTAVIYFYGANGLPELPVDNPSLKDLSSSNPQNPAYYIDAPAHDQWPIYTDLDSTADNSWDSVPDEIKDATWIALRRVTKPENATEVSFTLTRPMKVYVAASQNDSYTDELDKAGFKEATTSPFMWRDNALQLVPAKLFVHDGQAGELIRTPLGQCDAVVMLKAQQ
jgi:beta-galactosidase